MSGARTLVGGAALSEDGVYRYRLWRYLNDASKRALFVMLNPSDADATEPDPTMTRCAGFAAREGCGRFDIVNLYAFRTPYPKVLREHGNPVGPDNEAHCRAALGELQRGDVIIAAWGAGADVSRAVEVTPMLTNRGIDVMCFGTCRNGMPRHPLFLRADAPLVRYA